MPYDKQEREEVKQKKTEKYGKNEVFAVPALRSYPLTKDGQPSEERTMSAWRYLHEKRDEHKLTDEEFKEAEDKIQAFAKKHFKKKLTSKKEMKKSLPSEVFLLPECNNLWPVTKGLQPNPELCNQAWQVIHMTRTQVILGSQNVDKAEARLIAFAGQHNIKLDGI